MVPRRMMLYPRSFLGLLLAGFTLVILPLVGALAYSAWNTERLAGKSRTAVFNASQAARASRSLVDRIAAIERVAQQMALLNDAELAVDYARVHRSFKQLAAEIAQLPLDEAQSQALNVTVEHEQNLYELLTDQTRPRLDAQAIGEPHRRADRQRARRARDQQPRGRPRGRAPARERRAGPAQHHPAAHLQHRDGARHRARAHARIARPISEIDAAIRQLGGADFSRPIAVRGPEDLRYLGRRLDWLRRRLEEFETQKNRFLRHVSHELKTPLTALREGAELLHDEIGGPLAPPQRQVVGIMRDNSVKLQRLIEELLDYQRALHAAASLEVKPVSLSALVHDAAHAHELAAQAKGLRLVIDAQSGDGRGRPGEAALDRRQPDLQRGEVHARRRHHHGVARARWSARRSSRCSTPAPACRSRSASRSSTCSSADGPRPTAARSGSRAAAWASPSRASWSRPTAATSRWWREGPAVIFV